MNIQFPYHAGGLATCVGYNIEGMVRIKAEGPNVKTMNQHGFSLVELIVVVAIMAALAGILAPAYMNYIEKTRIQRDESAASEIFRAAEIVVYSGEYLIESDVFATFNSQGIQIDAGISNAEAKEILVDHFGQHYSDAVPVSKKYKSKTYTITIQPAEDELSVPHIVGNWS